MNDSTVIALRVEKRIGDLIRSWAKAENRTIANFMTNLVNREFSLRHGKAISLESLDAKLDAKLDRLEQKIDQLKSQKQKRKDDEPSVFEMDFENNPDVVSEESWRAWIAHLYKLKSVKVNHYFVSNQFKQLVQLYNEEDWDCDALIEYLIEHNQKSIFVPTEWKRK